MPNNTVVEVWAEVIYGNGTFVAFPGSQYEGSDMAAYSTDGGRNWAMTTMPSKTNNWALAYGDGTFIAVAVSGKTAYSTNGINWTAGGVLPSEPMWSDATYGDGKFVVVAWHENKSAYSTDGGRTWILTTLPDVGNGNWSGVAYGNGTFIAVNCYINKAAYSTDGITWTTVTVPNSEYYGVTYGDGLFVVVTSNSLGEAAYSTDGIKWTEIRLPSLITAELPGGHYVWNDVTYRNGMFVGITENGNKAAYSADGVNWTEVAMPLEVTMPEQWWLCMAYGDYTPETPR